jgi:thiol-disulfide isomerase/thioredoxin
MGKKHFIKLYILALSVLFSAISLSAQVRVSGSAPEFVDQTFYVLMHEDEFLKEPQLAGTFSTDSQGQFSFSIALNKTSVMVLRFGYANLKFFVKPGADYTIRIPTEKEGLLRSPSTETYSSVFFENLSTSDPNARISAFSEMYDRFFAEYSFEIAQSSYPGSRAFVKASSQKLKSTQLIAGEDSIKRESGPGFLFLSKDFTQKIDSISRDWDDYSRLYARSICAELQLSAGRNPNDIFKEFIAPASWDKNNPGYCTLLEVFYNNAFQSMRFVGSAKRIATIANQGQTCDSIFGFLSPYEVFSVSGSRDYGILQLLRNMRKEGMIDSNVYLRLMNENRDRCLPDFLRPLAQSLIEKEELAKKGWPMPELKLLNTNEELVKIEQKQGFYTYFLFFSSWSKQSIEELILLEDIAEKYRKDVQVVCISIDEDFEDFKGFVLGSKRLKLLQLYGFSDALIREKTGVYSVPQALLFDPEGKLLYDYTPLPTDDLETPLKRLTFVKEEKLKVWDD